MDELSPVVRGALIGSQVSAAILLIVALALCLRVRRVHPLMLGCIGAASISWIEAPYDWAMYAQFPPALPRMPAWWPLNWTWGGGVPSSVPTGYVSFMILPALIAVGISRWLTRRFGWRVPQTLLTNGLVVGTLYAFWFDGILGALLGVTYYGRVIPGLAIRAGTINQYPLYDAVAMGVQMMTATYLIGRTSGDGRSFVDGWSEARTKTRFGASVLTIVAVVVMANIVYLSVFGPHYVTKVMHLQTVAPTQQIFPGVPNQPL